MKSKIQVFFMLNFIRISCCVLLALFCYTASAQTFVPPDTITSYADTYPSTPANPQWAPRSNYAYSKAYINGNYYDLLISAWKDANGNAHIVWRGLDATNPYSLGTISADQEFMIPSASNIYDIGVGIVSTPSGYQAVVAYNNVVSGGAGGVFLKIYDVLTTGPQLNTTPVSTTTLYSAYFSTRVNVNSRQNNAAIVWNEADPTSSFRVIKCLTIDGGSFNSPVLIDNAKNNINGAVAFLYNTQTFDLNMHFVYFNPSTNTFTESVVDYNTMWAASSSTFVVTATVEDINTVLSSPTVPVLASPANFDYENWAYTYRESNQIRVRVMDHYTSGGVGATRILTNGSLGNVSLNTWTNTIPTITYEPLSFGMGPGSLSMYVGWQSVKASPLSNRLVCVQLNLDGSTLQSSSDYLLVPFVTTNTPSGMILGKNNEASQLYAIYSYTDATGANKIGHQLHYWIKPATSFRAESNDNKNIGGINIVAWPNPFTSTISLDVPSVLQNEMVKISMTDLLGRIILNKEIKGCDLSDIVGGYLQKMKSGNYWLKISKPSLKYAQVLPLVKTK